MKYLSEYRDGEGVHALARAISREVTRPWTIMEVCGGQTHSIVKYGLANLLPKELKLVHGPGCPVCVTPLEKIERALEIAASPEVIFCSFGDMLRVPGESRDLLAVKAGGGDVRIVYSPLDAVEIASQRPDRQVVFFSVGFETTAPTTAVAVLNARQRGLKNFSLLVSHVLVPPAIDLILSSPDNQIQGFLLAGHVCTVMGYEEYEPQSERYRCPMVVTGFEPLDIMAGILQVVRQLEQGEFAVGNQYSRVVKREGNRQAKAVISEVFEVADQAWRGLGTIPRSGLKLREKWASYDADNRFPLGAKHFVEPVECLSGLVLQGKISPRECPAFGRNCTPNSPLGAPMVSSEGACAAYYQYALEE